MRQAEEQTVVPEWSMTAGVAILLVLAVVVGWMGFRERGAKPVPIRRPPAVSPATTPQTAPLSATGAPVGRDAEVAVATLGATAFVTGDWKGVPVAPSFVPPSSTRRSTPPMIVSVSPGAANAWVVAYKTAPDSPPLTANVFVVPVAGSFAVSGGGLV